MLNAKKRDRMESLGMQTMSINQSDIIQFFSKVDPQYQEKNITN